MYDLSILIPARNEQFLARTVEDILANKRGKTQIIVGLDGAWSEPGVPDHPDLKIVYYAQSIGQRAMTNQLCRLSKAKYIIKCDAHCAFDEGFDVKMMADMQDDWTMVPIMKNLHAFDWVCPQGHRRYQGPSGPCADCGEPTTQDVCWIAKQSPQSTAYCFDRTLHFQYAGWYKKREGYKAGIIVGYELSFDDATISPGIISLFADLANSHLLACSEDCFRRRQKMSSDAVGFASIDCSGCVRTSQIFGIGNKLKMTGVDAASVEAEVIDDQNIPPSASRQRADQPSVGDAMCHVVLVDTEVTISRSVDASNPIPTSGSIINSDIINKFRGMFGGEFVYDEVSGFFHNGSVTLKLIRDKDLSYTMSLQGSFFMMTRDKYWELNICDEGHGSWGQQGVEVACKTWLSGGQVMVNHKTWYGHMFRTQGGDFGFPYELKGRDVDKARKYSRDLWFNNKWPLAKHDLQWLVDKFAPVRDWETRKGIIFYTDNRLNLKIAHMVQKQLRGIGLPIVSASLKPMPKMGKNVHLPLKRGTVTYFKQIIAALEASESEIVFFCEHDVLYHPSHFNFTPSRRDKFYYNHNVWRVREDGFAVTWDANQVAELCCYRNHALEFYRTRLKEIETKGFNRSYEPGGRDPKQYENWRSEYPNIDIRHGQNLTKSKWSLADFRDKSGCVNWQESTISEIPGWDNLKL